MEFSPWSYADQLKKYMPTEANTVIRRLGLGETKRIRTNRKAEPRVTKCKKCEEEFLATCGRQNYCLKNSEGINCSNLNKYEKTKERRKRFYS